MFVYFRQLQRSTAPLRFAVRPRLYLHVHHGARFGACQRHSEHSGLVDVWPVVEETHLKLNLLIDLLDLLIDLPHQCFFRQPMFRSLEAPAEVPRRM